GRMPEVPPVAIVIDDQAAVFGAHLQRVVHDRAVRTEFGQSAPEFFKSFELRSSIHVASDLIWDCTGSPRVLLLILFHLVLACFVLAIVVAVRDTEENGD